jgi:RNA polymerase sigma-70 factor (ECF subfamily)
VETELITKAQHGDQVALARLLQAHYLPVKKYLITVAMDRSLAEDLTQETMIRAIERIGQYSFRAKFSTWLIAIASHVYLDYLRRRKREQRLQDEAGAVQLLATAGPESGVADLMERLQALPRDVAMPVILKHYYGYTYEEIAAVMAIPEGTVKSRIHNGVRALRKGMSDNDD